MTHRANFLHTGLLVYANEAAALFLCAIHRFIRAFQNLVCIKLIALKNGDANAGCGDVSNDLIWHPIMLDSERIICAQGSEQFFGNLDCLCERF